MSKLNPSQVEKLVAALLGKDRLLERLGAFVVTGTANIEGGIWMVAVKTIKEAPKKFEYYEHLSAVEDRLRDDKGIEILIAPAGVQQSK